MPQTWLQRDLTHSKVLPHHVLLCLVWCSAALAPASAQAVVPAAAPEPVAPTGKGPKVRRVATGQELQQAFNDAVQHIVITAHLDLRALEPYFEITRKGYAFDRPVLINRGTFSVRVCLQHY